MFRYMQDGQLSKVQPILLTEMHGWSCWRFNIAVKVQQQQQEVFYTISADPFGHRYASTALLQLLNVIGGRLGSQIVAVTQAFHLERYSNTG